MAKAKYAIPNGNRRRGRWREWNCKLSVQVDGHCKYEENEWWKIVVARVEAMFVVRKAKKRVFFVFCKWDISATAMTIGTKFVWGKPIFAGARHWRKQN